MAGINAALAQIRNLKPGERPCYAKIARQHGVDRSTLSRRARGVQESRDCANNNQRKLSITQQDYLAKYIVGLTERHLPPTREMIQNFAIAIGHCYISMSWVERFLTSYKSTLLPHYTTGMDAVRHAADSEQKYAEYFKLLGQKITEYSIEARHTYNMDEKGFAIGVVGRDKRIFSRADYKKKKGRQSLQDGDREWVTILATICADGDALPPGVIYASKARRLRSNWVEDITPGKHQVFVAASSSGWTNDELGVAWLEQVFDRYTKKKARRAWRLLITDGHGSHVTMDFLDYCDRNRILVCIYPPHSTHTLQPLDVVAFKPLAQNYSSALTHHLHATQGLGGITKGDFFRLFWSAWVKTMRKELVESAFEATGLEPFNPDRIINKYRKLNNTNNSDNSSLSEFEGKDWRKADRVMKSAINDNSERDARRALRALHKLCVNNELLRLENKKLRKTAAYTKKRKHKGGPLDLQQRKVYEHKPQFWSPRKVREARYRNKVNKQLLLEEDARKADDRVKKANTALQNKLEKERRSKAYKEKLENAKVKRAEAAAEQERKQKERNAQKALQLPQLGKRKASQKPPAKPPAKKRRVGGATAACRGVVAAEPAPEPRTHTTRSGRKATLYN